MSQRRPTDLCGYCSKAREEHWPGRWHTFVEPVPPNTKGNTCDCGSSAEHKRAPGCTPPTPTCQKCGHAGTEADPHTCGLPGRLGLVNGRLHHIASPTPAAQLDPCVLPGPLAATHPRQHEGRGTATPAAMLGEALGKVGEIHTLLLSAGELDRHIVETLSDLETYITEAIAMQQREAEAREATAKGLGTPRADGGLHMPLPVTTEEARAQGLTFAPQDPPLVRRIREMERFAVAPAETCWTAIIGAPAHNLGELPEKCFTCDAHRNASMRPVVLCSLCDRPFPEHDITLGRVACPAKVTP